MIDRVAVGGTRWPHERVSQVQFADARGEPTGGITALRSAAQHAGADQSPQRTSSSVFADPHVDSHAPSTGGDDQETAVIGSGIQAQVAQYRPGGRAHLPPEHPLAVARGFARVRRGHRSVVRRAPARAVGDGRRSHRRR